MLIAMYICLAAAGAAPRGGSSAALTRTRNNGAAPRMLDAEQYCSDSDSDDPLTTAAWSVVNPNVAAKAKGQSEAASRTTEVPAHPDTDPGAAARPVAPCGALPAARSPRPIPMVRLPDCSRSRPSTTQTIELKAISVPQTPEPRLSALGGMPALSAPTTARTPIIERTRGAKPEAPARHAFSYGPEVQWFTEGQAYVEHRSIMDSLVTKASPKVILRAATSRAQSTLREPSIPGWRDLTNSDDRLMLKQLGLFNPHISTNTLQIDERSFQSATLARAEKALKEDERRIMGAELKCKQAMAATLALAQDVKSSAALVAERDDTIQALRLKDERKAAAHAKVMAERDGQIMALRGKARVNALKNRGTVDALHAVVSDLRMQLETDAAAKVAALAAKDATLEAVKSLADTSMKTLRAQVAKDALASAAMIAEREGTLQALKAKVQRDATSHAAKVNECNEQIRVLKERAQSTARESEALVHNLNERIAQQSLSSLRDAQTSLEKLAAKDATFEELRANADARVQVVKAEADARAQALQADAKNDAKAAAALLSTRDETICLLKEGAANANEKSVAEMAIREATIQELQATVKVQDCSNEELRASVTQGDSTIRMLDATIKDHVLAISQKETELKHSATQVSDLNSVIDVLKRQAEEAAATHSAVDEAIRKRAEQIEALKSTVADRDLAIEKLNGLMNDLKRQAAEAAVTHAAVDEAIRKRDGQIEALTLTVADRDLAIEELNISAHKDAEERSSMSLAISERVTTIGQRDEQIRLLNATVADRDDAIEALTASAEKDAGERACLSQTIEERDHTIEALRAESGSELSVIDELRAMIDVLKAQVDKDNAARDVLSAGLERQSADMVALRVDAEGSRAAYASLLARQRWKLVRDHGVVEVLKKKAKRDMAWTRALVAVRDGTIATLQRYGRVRVRVSHAADLRGVRGIPDPFITLLMGGRVERTHCCKGTVNPRFEWECVFGFESVELALSETIIVEAFDQRIAILDNKLGCGSVRLESQRDALEAGATVDIVVPIEHNYYLSVNKPLTRKTVSAGSVHISLIWERAGGQ